MEFGNPLGVDNQSHINEMIEECEASCFAWGNYSIIRQLEKRYPSQLNLNSLLHKPNGYIELSKNGIPKHPLFLKSDLPFTLYKNPS